MKKFLLVGLLVMLLGLTACSAADVPEVGGSTCPTAGEGTEAYTSEANGYCLLYPAGYTVTEFEDGSIRIEEEPVAEPHPMPPFATIEVTSASSGFTPEDAADEVAADAVSAVPDLEVGRSDVTVGGEPGVMLDNLPGQDLNRQVMLVHNGLYYRLTFYPADPSVPEYEQMLMLYDTVLNDFTFTTPAQ